MANARKRSGTRKVKVPKEEPEAPRPQTLTEWVASHRVADPRLVAEFSSSLEVHGERAEDRIPKEFLPWLRRFAKAVEKEEFRIQAWDALKSKCDALLLLSNLYLFTYPGKTTPDVLQDACRFLKEGLDGLLPRYSRIYEDTSALLNHPKLRLLTVLSEDLGAMFDEPLHLVRLARRELGAARRWAAKMGSYRTEAHDLDLYSMATRVRKATGDYHFPELAALTEAAFVAHEVEYESVLEENLKQRVYRYVRRFNLDRR